jgi:DNA/RNA endonuclease YhcR with UshA esterase domain
MAKKKGTVEIRWLGKIPKRAAIVMLVLLAFGILGAVSATNLAVNYGILRARVLFLEKITTGEVVPEDIDELYERALKLQEPMDLSPKLNEILQIVERVEGKLDKPVVTSAKQLESLKGGQIYLVGVITKVTSKSPNLFLTVNDVFVPLFNMESAFRNLKTGYKIAVAGKVQEYNGELEVVPDSGYDILVLEAG